MPFRKKLSPVVVESAKPESTQYRIWDTQVRELFLRVLPSGVKSWNVQWSRSSSVALGKWPAVTVSAARVRARTALVETSENGKPAALTRHETAHAATLGTFIAKEYGPWAAANRKTGRDTGRRLRTCFADFQEKPLPALSAWIVEKWRSERLEAGIKPATVNRDINALKACLSKAVEWGFIDAHPLVKVKPIKTDSTRVRYLSNEEAGRLRDALIQRDAEGIAARQRANQWRTDRQVSTMPVPEFYTDHLTPMILLSLNTGLRRGELTALTWADVDPIGKRLTVRAATAKSGKTRYIPLNEEAMRVVARWRAHGGSEVRLFPMHDARSSWDKLLRDAKIEGFRWHDMRHDFASKLVMAGVDLNSVRTLLGHADLKMTLRYAHLAPAHLADAVAKL